MPAQIRHQWSAERFALKSKCYFTFILKLVAAPKSCKDAVIKGVRRGQKNSPEAKSKNVKGFKNTGTFVSFYMKETCFVVIEILRFRKKLIILYNRINII